MRTPTFELIRQCAMRVLANRDAGRGVDPLTVEWAEALLKANPLPKPPIGSPA